ncbi:hypothetical protein LIER_24798 [Lithospermum erythrorhizon]|uniref:Reverse transcriptase zinc-binding domain-containing protein n=1 Tax=Lithospermum erythrorhizon TaxID=34254 RepID=A0AAV3R6Q1_LITER
MDYISGIAYALVVNGGPVWIYSAGSGCKCMKRPRDKRLVLLSPRPTSNVREEDKEGMLEVLGVVKVVLEAARSFGSCMKFWQTKAFSKAGKEVLLKPVLQSIPTYSMECFRVPFSVGMGFLTLRLFNIASLAKKLWRLVSEPKSALGLALKAKYFHDVRFGRRLWGPYHPSLGGLNEEQNSRPSSSNVENHFWSKLWELKLPSKVKHFTWRLYRDILTNGPNLRSRGVQVIDVCPLCGKKEEASLHLFQQCHYTWEVS